MVLYDASKLAYARHGDQSWTPILIEDSRVIPMDDMMIMDNNVYGVYDDGTMVYWKVNEFFGSEPIKPVSFSLCQCKNYTPGKWLEETYLVQSGNDILMVVRHKKEVSNSDVLNETFIYETYDFDVYKLNPKDKSWVYTEDVGNVALFVGCNHSMSVSVASAAKHLQTNCIYFTDDENKGRCLKDRRGHDMGVFDIITQKISRFYEGDDISSTSCPPIWFIPNL